MDSYKTIQNILLQSEYALSAVLDSGFRSIHTVKPLLEESAQQLSAVGLQTGGQLFQNFLTIVETEQHMATTETFQHLSDVYVECVSYVEHCQSLLEKEMALQTLRFNKENDDGFNN